MMHQETELDKIIKIIKECKYGIHDLSRTEFRCRIICQGSICLLNMAYFALQKFGEKIQNKK